MAVSIAATPPTPPPPPLTTTSAPALQTATPMLMAMEVPRPQRQRPI